MFVHPGSYSSKGYASPQSIFGPASSPSASSTSSSSSPTNFSLPEALPAMAGMGWPPGAFHRFRWCYVNEGNFCKADANTVVPAGTTQCCAWCQLAMP